MKLLGDTGGIKPMTSKDALRHIKSFMAECWTSYPKWCWQKDKIPQALAECGYYWTRLTPEDKELAWQEICKHSRFCEKFSDHLKNLDPGRSLLQ